MAARVSTGESRNRRPRRSLVRSTLGTVAIYSFAGWAYIALNAVVHPVSLGWRLTHFAPWPHEDTFGEVCFGVSFFSLLAYNLMGPG
jgi:hypothetical protein